MWTIRYLIWPSFFVGNTEEISLLWFTDNKDLFNQMIATTMNVMAY